MIQPILSTYSKYPSSDWLHPIQQPIEKSDFVMMV